MKNIDVIETFVNGGTKGKTTNIRIEGNKLINYNTVLAERINNMFVVNTTKYSQSTTTIQNKIVALIPQRQIIKNVTDIEMGASNLI